MNFDAWNDAEFFVDGAHVATDSAEARPEEEASQDAGDAADDHGVGRADRVGQGVGTALLDAVLAWADDHLGLVRLDLWLCTEDDRIRQFFTQAGFTPEGTLRAALFQAGHHRAVTVLARVREPGTG